MKPNNKELIKEKGKIREEYKETIDKYKEEHKEEIKLKRKQYYEA